MVHIWLFLSITINLMLGAFYIFRQSERLLSTIDYVPQKKNKLMLSVFRTFSNFHIIVGYFIVFFIIRRHYTKLIDMRSQYGLQDDVSNKTMRQNLCYLLILFLSICQLYVVRIARDILFIFDRDNVEYLNETLYFSKLILTFGICWSLYKRVQVVVECSQQLEESDNAISSTQSRIPNNKNGYPDSMRYPSTDSHLNVDFPKASSPFNMRPYGDQATPDQKDYFLKSKQMNSV